MFFGHRLAPFYELLMIALHSIKSYFMNFEQKWHTKFLQLVQTVAVFLVPEIFCNIENY